MTNALERDPSTDDIDAVLAFLPILEQPDFDPGVLRGPPLHHDTEPVRFEASPPLIDFIKALYDHDFVSSFDWSEWQPVAQRYAGNPSLLAGAGLGTVRKLITTHVRKDHFRNGHIAEAIRSGQLLAVLRRLKDIRAALGTQVHP